MVRLLRIPVLSALLLTVVLVAGGCFGGDGRGGPGAPAASPTPTQPSAASNALEVTVSAQGSGGAAALARATRAATPELERFLTRYLAIAFAPSAPVDAGGELAKLFDEPLRGGLAGDLPSLSLGAGAAQVSEVRRGPSTATAALLSERGKPLAATVRLSMDGTAVTRGQPVPISLRSTFQMLRGGAGWVIVAYDSQAEVPA